VKGARQSREALDLAETALIRAACSAPSSIDLDHLLFSLAAIEPDALGRAAWIAATVLTESFPPDSSLLPRLRGLRRRNYCAAQVAGAIAFRLSHQLAVRGVRHAVFGELLVASRYPRPHDRPVDYLAIWVDPTAETPALQAAIAAVPGSAPARGDGPCVRSRIDGLPIGLHRGWPVWMGCADQQTLAAAGSLVTVSGDVPVVEDWVEALRLLTTAGVFRNQPDGWVLDLHVLCEADSTKKIWRAITDLAVGQDRAMLVAWSSKQARLLGALPHIQIVSTLSDSITASWGQRLLRASARIHPSIAYRLASFAQQR
jgi:hypothetical protein